MLRLRLFGNMEVLLDGVALAAPASRRAWVLLAWLALHPGMNARTRVAAAFWPDVPETSARASLRSAIWSLRRALGPGGDAYLSVTRDLIGLDGAGVGVDVVDFDTAVAAGDPAEAARLAEGELLSGFDEEWIWEAREALRVTSTRVFEQLAVAAEDAGDTGSAVGWTRRQVALDPLAEDPQRRLMRRLTAHGDRAAALAGYGRFSERLRRELQVAPSADTRRLAEQIAAGPPARPPAPELLRALPLIGRERELRQLLGAWQRARAGFGAVVTISGEPGIGKTRMAAELLERARTDGARVAGCAALDLGGGAPLALWAELIGDLVVDLPAPPADAAWPSALEVLVPDLEHRFGRRPTPRLSAVPDLERARLFEATVSLLDWAGRRPVMLLLEDVHAADAASLELAGYVGRRLTRMPVLIVLTRRPLPRRTEVDALEHALRTRRTLIGEVALVPLRDAQIARLVRRVAPLAEPDLAQVIAAARGNPLLAVESARALARGEREPPASLRGAVRAALAPLPADARRIVDLAAVAGRDLAADEIDALQIDAAADAATDALDCGLLVAGPGRLGFSHALLREAAYLDLPEPRRADLHGVLAGALTARDGQDSPRYAAEAARHYRLAGREGLAVGQLVRAAAHARSVAALGEAVQFLTDAVELAPARVDLLVDLAEVQAWRGDVEASEAAFDEALPRLEVAPPEELARVWARRANWNGGALCRPYRVRDSARRAIEILDATATPAADVRIQALAVWAWGETVAGDASVADELLARVREVLGGGLADDLVAHWVANAEALSLVRRGRFEDSYDSQLAACDAAQRAGRPDLAHSCWLNAACAAACAGDMAQALRFVDRGVTSLHGSGLVTLEVQLHAARALLLMRMSRFDEARAASEVERALADRMDNPALQAASEYDRGLVALALGTFTQAERLLADALRHDAPVSRPLARLARAEALAGLGRHDDAEQEVRATALEPVGPGDMPDTLVPRLTRLQGLIAAGRGDAVLARRRLREAADGWRRVIGTVGEGDRYAATLADFGRPPVAGLVEPARELDRVLAELEAVGSRPA